MFKCSCTLSCRGYLWKYKNWSCLLYCVLSSITQFEEKDNTLFVIFEFSQFFIRNSFILQKIWNQSLSISIIERKSGVRTFNWDLSFHEISESLLPNLHFYSTMQTQRWWLSLTFSHHVRSCHSLIHPQFKIIPQSARERHPQYTNSEYQFSRPTPL